MREYLRNTLRNTTDDPARPGGERKVNIQRYGVIPDMVYGHGKFGPVQADTALPHYVLAAEFERVTAECNELQNRLTVQDQRVDELTGLLWDWYEASAKGSIQVDNAAYHVVTATASALSPTTKAEPASDRGHCKSCAIEYSATNHRACPLCTRTTEAGDIWPAVSP